VPEFSCFLVLEDREPIYLKDLRKAQNAVKGFQVAAKWFPDAKAEAEVMTAFLEGLWSSVGNETERPEAIHLVRENKIRGQNYVLVRRCMTNLFLL
jgi:hypothetical protein